MKTANEILMEKRSNLKDGVPRQIHEETVYWKNVTKDEKVTQEGGEFYAQMPDGKKKVDWKPDEAAEAKKHLSGMAGKKESFSTTPLGDVLKESALERAALITAIERAASGDYDSNALYKAGGKQVRVVSSGMMKVAGSYLVLVTDQNSNPLGAPFYAGDLLRDPSGKWRAAYNTVVALAKHGKA